MLQGVYSALFVEPMLVYGSKKFAPRLGSYAIAISTWHVRASAILLGGLLAASGVCALMGLAQVASSMAALALACPFLLAFSFAKRFCYVHGTIRSAAVAGIANLGL